MRNESLHQSVRGEAKPARGCSSRYVAVNVNVLEGSDLTGAESVSLNLFDDVLLVAKRIV